MTDRNLSLSSRLHVRTGPDTLRLMLARKKFPEAIRSGKITRLDLNQPSLSEAISSLDSRSHSLPMASLIAGMSMLAKRVAAGRIWELTSNSRARSDESKY